MILEIHIQGKTGIFEISAFERQVITDTQNDWNPWPSTEKEMNIYSQDGSIISIPTGNESECKMEKALFPEIKSVSYMSDEKRLNSTIWMSPTLLQTDLLKNRINPTNLNSTDPGLIWYNVSFTMAIDVISVFDKGVDYRMELFGSNTGNNTDLNKQWKLETYEISVDGTNKLVQTQTFDNFPFTNKEFVEFSVDLKSISNPQKYKILIYETSLYVKDGKFCRTIDSTNWILSPPPDFHIIASPSSIFMRPGENKDIMVTVTGNTDLQANASLKIDFVNNENASLRFLSNETVISSVSNGSSILHINTSNYESISSKHYIVPILANISFPSEIISSDRETYYNNNSESLLERSDFVITVLPSLTWIEKAEEILRTVRPFGELWQIFAAIGGALIAAIFYFRKNRGSKDENRWNREIDY